MIEVAWEVWVSSSSIGSNLRWTSELALIKVALGQDADARIRFTTYVANWSSVGASAFDSVDRDSLWWTMAADGMPL